MPYCYSIYTNINLYRSANFKFNACRYRRKSASGKVVRKPTSPKRGSALRSHPLDFLISSFALPIR